MSYVSHPFIKKDIIEKRSYQEKILASIATKNSLVVLPTGLGKTIIAAMLVAHKLSRRKGKILFLAPTRPLVLQHKRTFIDVLNIKEERIVLFTGATPPKKRQENYGLADIIFATPQVIENDIISKKLDLKDFSLLIIDEAHRATGDYAYVFIAKRYQEENRQGTILGITASPGYDRVKIKEIVKNLGIENVHIENEESPDVAPYVHDIDIEWIKLDFPQELEFSRKLLKEVYEEKLNTLYRFKLTSKPKQYVNRKDIIVMGEKLRNRLSSSNAKSGNLYTGIMAQAAALKLSHSIELLETQGALATIAYFEKVNNQKSRTSRELLKDGRIIRAISHLKKYEKPHPKITRLIEVLKNLKPDQKVIVFSQYRNTAQIITKEINKLQNINAVRFVGQASKEDDQGLTQIKQKAILDEFRNGEYNVLVATSVAEEGLDIPSVDMVIFFEPIPSEIRTIQRRGRTGRHRTGKVIIMLMRGTLDEAYYKVANDKEIRMQKIMQNLERKQSPMDKDQIKLDSFIDKDVLIICDNRENPNLIKILSQKANIDVKTLNVGDYILSSRVGLERKTTDDFLRSLFENRLFEQIKSLSGSFERALLIVEGEDLFSKHQTNRAAIRNALLSTMVDFKVGVIFSKDINETSEYIYDIARREQGADAGLPRLRGEKKSLSLRENQIYIVEGLPNVSAKLARRLLEHFGSVEGIIRANVDELKEVEGIGNNIANKIKEVTSTNYE